MRRFWLKRAAAGALAVMLAASLVQIPAFADEMEDSGPAVEEVEDSGPAIEEIEDSDPAIEEIEDSDSAAEEIEDEETPQEESEEQSLEETTEDTVVTAESAEAGYRNIVITIDLNGGYLQGPGLNPGPITLERSEGVLINLEDYISYFYKPGYKYNGLYADQACTVLVPENKYIFEVHEDRTFYAGWREDENAVFHTVTFDAGEGHFADGSGIKQERYPDGYNRITIPEVLHDDPEMEIAGWTMEKGSADTITLDGELYIEGDVTYYALWGKNCTVTLDYNGGYYIGESEHFTVQTINATTGKTIFLETETADDPYIEGDEDGKWLAGWDIRENGETVETITSGRYVPSGDITLYARWVYPTTITFNANGGRYWWNGGYVESIDMKVLPEGQINPEHYPGVPQKEDGSRFVDWSYTPDGSRLVGGDSFFYSPHMEDITVYAAWANGKWIKDSTGWWYRHTDGSYTKNGWEKINGKWYLFDSRGYMLTGWQARSGKWYYLHPVNGDMLTGWQKVSGKWYYLNPVNGDMKTGWLYDGGKWYYLSSSGAMVTGWQSIGGKWYAFNSSGAMLTGWQYISGKWYYMEESGAMVTGSRTIDGKEYRFDSSGACINPY